MTLKFVSNRSIIKVPKEMSDLTQKLLSSKLTNKHRLEDEKGCWSEQQVCLEKDPLDKTNDTKELIYSRWKRKGVEYKILSKTVKSFNITPPKMGVSQDKNIKAMLYLTHLRYGPKSVPGPGMVINFTLKEYALIRGYSEEEVAKGGELLVELKKDIIHGGCTRFAVDEIRISGKLYKHRGFLSVYTTLEYAEKKGIWKIAWNYPCLEWIQRLIMDWDKSRIYFKHISKELGDRNTSKKPYVHNLFNFLMRRRVLNGWTWPIKIKKLLIEIGFEESMLSHKPQYLFTKLIEGLNHIQKEYPDELSKIKIISTTIKQEQMPYTQEMGVEVDIELIKPGTIHKKFADIFTTPSNPKPDFREFYIMFYQLGDSECIPQIDYENPSEYNQIQFDIRYLKKVSDIILTEDEEGLLEEILRKITEWESGNYKIKFNKTQRRSFLTRCLSTLGFKLTHHLLWRELNMLKFLTKTLVEELEKVKYSLK